MFEFKKQIHVLWDYVRYVLDFTDICMQYLGKISGKCALKGCKTIAQWCSVKNKSIP